MTPDVQQVTVQTVMGHFGEWIQGRAGPTGAVALITLTCPQLWVAAGPRACLPSRHLLGRDIWCDLAQTFDPASLAHLDLASPMIPGAGHGFSTAALVALARCQRVAEADIPALCLRAEGASDPLMLPHPDAVLWASRAGVWIDQMPRPPRAEVVGFHVGPATRTDARDGAFPDISDLIADWSKARRLADFAALASQSARRTTALRGPHDDPTEGLAQRFNALGHARAHTGSARALIFAPGTVPSSVAGTLEGMGLGPVLRFETGQGA